MLFRIELGDLKLQRMLSSFFSVGENIYLIFLHKRENKITTRFSIYIYT